MAQFFFRFLCEHVIHAILYVFVLCLFLLIFNWTFVLEQLDGCAATLFRMSSLNFVVALYNYMNL